MATADLNTFGRWDPREDPIGCPLPEGGNLGLDRRAESSAGLGWVHWFNATMTCDQVSHRVGTSSDSRISEGRHTA